MLNKTNHICKNPDCNKEYYACDACDIMQGNLWRQACCTRACYDVYKALCEAENQKSLQDLQDSQVKLQEETKIITEDATEHVEEQIEVIN